MSTGKIKTVAEATFDRMNECSKELAKQFLKSVRSIYGSTKYGKPSHIGSGVLISYGSNKILLTAAHVMDHNELTTLYISGERSLVSLTGHCSLTVAPNGNRRMDKLDFALLLLSDETIQKMGQVEYLDEHQFQVTDLPPNERCCLALGFPNSRNKRCNNTNMKVKQEPFVYTSVLKTDDFLYRSLSANPAYHYLLDYCSNHSKDEENNTVNSVSPKGVSGGGLFLIEGMANPESYKPNAKCNGKLLGILIEYHKNEKVLLFTKLSVVLKYLQENNITSPQATDT
ncbi:trypsin-like serine protease [Mariprofundus ferrooxydans]|uniref:trypsin-like serine protease n=1 Tax=Mariprofundus ferrooxydans TaxID=314344 RepID=UPI0002D371FE|nr:trypsin-like serine protease [Mariprofundus ferrooxydans]